MFQVSKEIAAAIEASDGRPVAVDVVYFVSKGVKE